MLDLQATSVYDYNELTLQKLLNKFHKKINETVDISNKALSFLEWLKSEGLPNEVVKELELMYQDGRLSQAIDTLSDNLNLKIDNLTNELNIKVEKIKNEYIPNVNIDGGVW